MNGLLCVDNLSIRFGGVQAVGGVTLAVQKGELLGLIGPNGAGKTTLLSLITGILKPDSGRVILAGEDISGLSTHERVRRGIALTHQIVRPFSSLTVLENVVLAAGLKRNRMALGAMFQVSRVKEEKSACALLERLGLEKYKNVYPGVLPLGHLKRMEVARALALNSKCILFDEPLAGLNQKETKELGDTITELNRDGMTVILVEHNLGEVLRIASRLVVLDGGGVIADGNPATVMDNPSVRSAYLGNPREENAGA